MNITSQNICEYLSQGASVTISSTPFSIGQLRKMAKAAQMGNSILTLVIHDELTLADIKSIVDEAPRHVALNVIAYPQGC